MSAAIEITYFGDLNGQRTVAELSHSGSGEFIGLVYEAPDGWKEEIPDSLRSDEVTAAAREARKGLQEYVNRTGANPPEGLSREGLALWLMLKSDGTAMGRPYPQETIH